MLTASYCHSTPWTLTPHPIRHHRPLQPLAPCSLCSPCPPLAHLVPLPACHLLLCPALPTQGRTMQDLQQVVQPVNKEEWRTRVLNACMYLFEECGHTEAAPFMVRAHDTCGGSRSNAGPLLGWKRMEEAEAGWLAGSP